MRTVKFLFYLFSHLYCITSFMWGAF